MKREDKLNDYIDHLQEGKDMQSLLESLDDEELSELMKTSRMMNKQDKHGKPDPLFVNKLEEELICIGCDEEKTKKRNAKILKVIHTAAGFILIVSLGFIAFQEPESDITQTARERGGIEQTAKVRSAMITPATASEAEIEVVEVSSSFNSIEQEMQTLEDIIESQELDNALTEIELASF